MLHSTCWCTCRKHTLFHLCEHSFFSALQKLFTGMKSNSDSFLLITHTFFINSLIRSFAHSFIHSVTLESYIALLSFLPIFIHHSRLLICFLSDNRTESASVGHYAVRNAM